MNVLKAVECQAIREILNSAWPSTNPYFASDVIVMSFIVASAAHRNL